MESALPVSLSGASVQERGDSYEDCEEVVAVASGEECAVHVESGEAECQKSGRNRSEILQGAWNQLTSADQARLLVLVPGLHGLSGLDVHVRPIPLQNEVPAEVYHTQPHGSLPSVDCRKVCFLETRNNQQVHSTSPSPRDAERARKLKDLRKAMQPAAKCLRCA